MNVFLPTPNSLPLFKSSSFLRPSQEDTMAKMVAEVGEPLDMVINNAGYFYGPEEKVRDAGESPSI